MAADSDGHGGHEHDVAEAQQQCGEELEAIGESLGIVCAAPAVPACGWRQLPSTLQHLQGLGRDQGRPFLMPSRELMWAN